MFGALKFLKTDEMLYLNEATGRQIANGEKTPIIDLHCLSFKQKTSLLKLFLPPAGVKNLSHEGTTQCLLQYIPQKIVANSLPEMDSSFFQKCKKCFARSFNLFDRLGCIICGLYLCDACLPHTIKLPKKGVFTPTSICEDCFTANEEEDVNDWMITGKVMLDKKTNDSLYAAIGCFTFALCCEIPAILQKLPKISGFLLASGYPHVALPFIATFFSIADSPKQKLLARSQIASFCLSMVNDDSDDLDEKKMYIELAKQAVDTALSETSLEMPTLAKQEIQVKAQIAKFSSIIENNCKLWLKETRGMLDDAWCTRNFPEMFRIMEELPEDADVMENEIAKKLSFDATDSFLRNQEIYFSKFLPSDKHAFQLIRGVHRVRTGKITEGLADIEAAAWGGDLSECMIEEAIDVFISHFDQTPTDQTISSFYTKACKELVTHVEQCFKSPSARPTIKPVLLPSNNELNPTNAIISTNWPTMRVTGRDTKPIKLYERAIHKQVETGKFNEHQAGLSYIDLSQACGHPMEIALCFIHAAMWFYQELTNKISSMARPEKSALKKIIFTCIDFSFEKTQHIDFHPGSKLHITRYGLAIAVNTTKIAEKYVTKDDTELIKALVNSVIYNCRFCPFWKTPSTKPSEGNLLHFIIEEIHEKFFAKLHLQEVIPLRMFELHYQTYENSLFHVSKQNTNTKDCLEKAMQAFLDDKGLSWEDVANSITSPMTPRDKDGWLTPQKQLGGDLPYSSIRGFEFDTIDSTIKIYHDKNGPGLFSMNDVNEALLYQENARFISLDPPSLDQPFHPFQEIRCDKSGGNNDKTATGLEGTRCLYTMLHADYLLKSFSVGVEVSAIPPFNQRPCKEGLIAHLPPHLKEVLKPISERGYNQNKMHRFWINAIELTVSVDQHGDSVKEFKLGEPKMAIKTHPIAPGRDGKLKDTEESGDSDGLFAQFAADLTKHYDELEKYFPIFKRLKELAKLQYLPNALKNVQKFLKQNADEEDKAVEKNIVGGSNHNERYQSFRRKVVAIMTQSTNEKRVKNSKECTWVPAAMNVHELDETTMAICYGGVILHPEIKQGRVSHRIDKTSYITLSDSTLRTRASQWRNTSSSSYSQGRSYRSTGCEPATRRSARYYGGNSSGGKNSGPSLPLSQWKNNSSSSSSQGRSNRTTGSVNIPPGTGGGGYHGGGSSSGGNNSGPSLPLLFATAFLISNTRNNDDKQKPKTLQESFELTRNWIVECTKRGLRANDAKATRLLCPSPVRLSFTTDAIIPATGEKINPENLPNEQHDRVKNCVYCIIDAKTGEMYIGLTTRELYKRINEHCRNPKSAVYKHFLDANGRLRIEDMRIMVLFHQENISRNDLHKIEREFINNKYYPGINIRKAFTQRDVEQRKTEIEQLAAD